MSRGRRWGSITRYRGAGWRVRAGDDERSQVGLYLDEQHGGEMGALRVAEEALEEARRAWLTTQTPTRGRGVSLLVYGRDTLDRWERNGTRRAIDRDRARFEFHIANASFANDPIAALDHRTIQRWIRKLSTEAPHGARADAGRKRSRQTVLNILNLLRAILRQAIEEEILDESPARGIIVPRSMKTEEEFLLLEKHEVLGIVAREPDELVSLPQLAIVIVAALEGLRPGELFGLRWPDIGPASITVRRNRDRATKGGRVRVVPLLDPVRAILDRLRAFREAEAEANRVELAPDALVWPSPATGGPYGEGYDMGWGHRAQAAAGYTQLGIRWLLGVRRNVPFKDLRHTCASALLRGWWVDQGWIERPLRMEEVAQWLGHASMTTTERHYARLAPGGLLDVVPERRPEA